MDDGRDREQSDQQEPGAQVRADSQPVPRETYLLPDGTPGLILSAMVAAVTTAGESSLLNEGDKKGVAATAVIDAARNAFTTNGIALLITTANVEIVTNETASGYSQPFVRMDLIIRCIASDATYLEHRMPGGGTTNNNKHVQAAMTAAMKSFYRHALMLSVETAQARSTRPRKAPKMSRELLAYFKFVQTVTTIDDLRDSGTHETVKALASADIAAARQIWQDRKEQIIQLDGSWLRAAQEKEKQIAWKAAEERKVQKAAAVADATARSGAKGDPIDLSATRPATAKDRPKR